MTPETFTGDQPALKRLFRLQRLLSAGQDARALIERARLLADHGAPRAALADATAALAADPADPLAMLVLADLSPPGPAHLLACEILASPFALPALRQAALRLVDARELPCVLPCTLPATLRLTVLDRAVSAPTGFAPQDVTLPLGRHGEVLAADHFLTRGNTARQVAGHIVPALPETPAVAKGAEAASLWVVMPVKDGGAVLAGCLDSLAAEAFPGVRAVIVDDCSAQPATHALLAAWSARPGVTVLRSAQPLGFTGAVNLALCAVGKGPVLLLNSDTWLPPGTLRRMLAHLADPGIGTVTPFTNHGGSFSVPSPRRGHAMPGPAAARAIAEQAARRNHGIAVDVLTGNGFAMLISGPCLAATGALSAHYDSGYYEEVDFCLRARARGFRHVAAADCFVGHVGAVSYGLQRRRLVAANRRRLSLRFPEYEADYLRFALADPLAPFRTRLTEAAGLQPLAEPPATAAACAVRLPVASPVPVPVAAGLHLLPAHDLTPGTGAAELAPWRTAEGQADGVSV